MNPARSFGWILSAGIHLLLLLGATLVFIEHPEWFSVGEENLSCSFASPWIPYEGPLARVDRCLWTGWTSASTDREAARTLPITDFESNRYVQGVPWQTMYYRRSDGANCPTCLHEILKDGPIRWILIEEDDPPNDPEGYFARRQLQSPQGRRSRWSSD